MATITNGNGPSPTVEVKLLRDDRWKQIQQNTFTRWVNQHLKSASGAPHVENLAADFADGIHLIRLAEVLSGRALPRFNRKPVMRTQKLDNISLALTFLQKEENIKIVNIDSSHIVDENLKLIMGLVWTLILHYSLSSAPAQDQAAPPQQESAPAKGGASPSPKQRLLAWIQNKLPQHQIGNFTSSWNDGIALGALVDACLDGKFGEWRQWDARDALGNTQRATHAAEEALGVEKLITAEELCNADVDEKSVMTYLAQFPRAQPQLLGLVSGLERGPLQGVPSTFGIELEREQLRPSVQIWDPRGQPVHALEVRPKGQDGTCPLFEVTYVPGLVGEHKIDVFALSRDEEAGSEVRLPVESALVHVIPAPQVRGLDAVAPGERRRFQVANVADHHQLDVVVADPDGREVVLEAGSERDEHGTVTCCYTPATLGQHLVSIRYAKRHIPGSPLVLLVLPSDASSTPLPTSVSPVDKSQTNGFDAAVKATSAGGELERVGAHRAEIATPERFLDCHNGLIHQLSRSQELPGLELERAVRPLSADASQVDAGGEGLAQFVPGTPAHFQVDASRTGADSLFVAVVTSKGPAQEVNVRHAGGNKYAVSYVVHAPTAAVQVFVKYGDRHVPGSPFWVQPHLLRNGGHRPVENYYKM